MGIFDFAILKHRRVIDVAITQTLAHYLHERKIRCSILSWLPLFQPQPRLLGTYPSLSWLGCLTLPRDTPLAHTAINLPH